MDALRPITTQPWRFQSSPRGAPVPGSKCARREPSPPAQRRSTRCGGASQTVRVENAAIGPRMPDGLTPGRRPFNASRSALRSAIFRRRVRLTPSRSAGTCRGAGLGGRRPATRPSPSNRLLPWPAPWPRCGRDRVRPLTDVRPDSACPATEPRQRPGAACGCANSCHRTIAAWSVAISIRLLEPAAKHRLDPVALRPVTDGSANAVARSATCSGLPSPCSVRVAPATPARLGSNSTYTRHRPPGASWTRAQSLGRIAN